MAMPFGRVRTGSDRVEEQRGAVLHLLRSQGFRALAAANLLGGGVRYAPGVDEKVLLLHLAAENLARFEAMAELYADLGAVGLFDLVESRAADLAPPRSWLEVNLATLILARASAAHLGAHRDRSFAPLAAVVADLDACEAEAIEATLHALSAADPSSPDAQAAFDRWLRVAIGSFAPTSPRGARMSDEAERAAAEATHELLAALAPLASRAGLRLPMRDEPTARFSS